MELLNLLLVVFLIVLTAIFVATEFAIIRVRSIRINQLAEQGNKNAVAAKKVLANLDGALSACQLGITVASIGLGWLGEPTVRYFLQPLFLILYLPESLSYTISIIIAFVLITFFNVVVGELAPKTVAIQKAETVTLILARPLIIFYKIMYPFIWVLNGSANTLTRLFGLKPASESEKAHSEEELRIILSESYKNGEINQSEYSYVNRVFEFDNRVAKEIMIPRMEMIYLNIHNRLEENLEIIFEEKYTRYPVIDEDKDHVLGMINAKEIFYNLMKGKQISLEDYIREIPILLENIPIRELLIKIQHERRSHMAILIDEYGGTSGLVTVEDILEEIVGEIHDEFDKDESPMIIELDPNSKLLDGKVLISEVNNLLKLDLDNSEVDTMAGWILSNDSDIREGQILQYDKYEFKVIEMDGHQIKKIHLKEREKQLRT
ncbi:HlyC/CorC family transporter [Priestia aryabhattai]|uniref:hemolysin family protein n=1 Tax=Priestia aryabhattai TaxID=412384 RepID=UPI001EBFE0EB|nr:hemolysin family protein [Priestia aryabhattai]MBY0094340.1 HlyC/CorC family transporter [Priestia aryabhattai]MBY0103655.1 HlyC/CorC family transporter [Priestia aryabhattai]